MDELTNKVQSSIDEAVNAGDKNALLEQMKTVDNAKIDTYNKAMLNDAPFLAGHSSITSCISNSQSYYIYFNNTILGLQNLLYGSLH